MKSPSSFSIVIPTLDRPDELIRTIDSIAQQNFLPTEIIIIDQSASSAASDAIKRHALFSRTKVVLKYVRDIEIKGLIEAKFAGSGLCATDIVCFLEDDVVLSDSYLMFLLKGFEDNPEAVGIGGVISNPPKENLLANRFSKLFRTGVFNDPRVITFTKTKLPDYIASAYISGGVSAWKKSVFSKVNFNLNYKFHYYEDIDFSLRVNDIFPGRTLISSRAKLDHIPSPLNRPNLFSYQRKKIFELSRFCIAHRQRQFIFVSALWLLVGIAVQSILELIFKANPSKILGLVFGIFDGIWYGLAVTVQKGTEK